MISIWQYGLRKWVDMSGGGVFTWKLKEGAPWWARKEFERFMREMEEAYPPKITKDGRKIYPNVHV